MTTHRAQPDPDAGVTFLPDLSTLLTQVPPDSIISRTISQRKDARTILFGFAPGQELSEHTAAKPALLYFVRGGATLTLGDQTMEVEAGAFAHMPPHLPHSIRAHQETIMLLIMIEQPA